MRAFISLDLSREAINEIKEIQENLRKKDLFTGKMTEKENLHLTLKFLEEISEEQANLVKKRLSLIKFEKFSAETGEIGVFSPDFIKIVWIKLNGDKIMELQKEIDEKLKDLFPIEARFMSHVTICRVKNVSDKKEFLMHIKKIIPKKIKFLIKDFSLKKSELLDNGPVYSDIERYKLI